MPDDDWDEKEAVVLDNGTGMVKAGFAGREQPDVVFPAVVGRPRKGQEGDILIGDDCKGKKGYRLKYPVCHGIVNDWDDMELVWKHVFKELDVEPTEQACLVTEAPLNPKKNREKMLTMLFESFEVPALYVQIQAVLSLYAAGRQEGVVVDSGDGVSHTVPIFDGRVIPSAVQRLEVAGRDLTDWMVELLNEDQEVRKFTTSVDREIAKCIKEKMCYLEMDFESAHDKWEEENDAFDEICDNEMVDLLPDGQKITVGRARFACPEALFDPPLMGTQAKGVHKVLADSINKCGIDCRKALWSSIVLSGGTTLIKNMEDRLENEARALAPQGAKSVVKVISDSSEDGRGIRRYSVWIGGAILAGLSSFSSEWITKSDYDEMGAGIVHKKCDALSGYHD